MEPILLPSDEEIRSAYREGEEAVIALFHRTKSQLAARVQTLEDRVSNFRLSSCLNSYPWE
jgi:hypothetical protein